MLSHEVSGQICVKNGGEVATEGLKLAPQVQANVSGDQFQDIAGGTTTITPAAQLPAGETTCYGYTVSFPAVENAGAYRVVSSVTITNHSGSIGEETGPFEKADFPLATSLSKTVEVDEEAALSAAAVCPEGFTCALSGLPAGALTGSTSVDLAVRVTNAAALCDSNFDLTGSATLRETDSGQSRSAAATTRIYTGLCENPTNPDAGCTLTIGYWKTHAGFTGRNADRLTTHLPLWLGTAAASKSVKVAGATQAVSLLGFSGEASNGINKLYAQLLAAKLNIARGATATAAAGTIAAADAFLAGKNARDWKGLKKADQQKVIGWAATLDGFNNGLIGPGHCE